MKPNFIVLAIVASVLVGLGIALPTWFKDVKKEPATEDINIALRMAVRENELAEVTLLLGAGGDPNAAFYGQSPLLLAIQWGDIELVKVLVEAGADVNKPGLRGGTPLAATNWNPNYEMAVYLLEQGANVNTADESGWTPLHRAVSRSGPQFVKLLLEHGANVNAETIYASFNSEPERGGTPINHYPADQGPKVVQLLIDYGADIHHLGIGENTPLHDAVTNIKVMQVLLDNGAEINAKNVFGSTPLHEAVDNHQYSPPKNPDDPRECIKFLVANGADIEARNDMGSTPVMDCLSMDEIEFLELLLELGADINTQDKDGDTLLHNLYRVDTQCEFASTLIELGADPEIKNQAGNTPVYYAILLGRQNLVATLLDNGSKYDLVVAAGLGNLQFIRKTMNGLDYPSRDEELERKALSIAANTGHLDVVDYFLEQGVEARLIDMVLIGYLDEIQHLIDSGADVNEDSEDGYFPLYEAGRAGNNEVIKLLVENGADLKAGDFLDSAISWEHFDAYKLLLDLGVDPNTQIGQNITPLLRAVSHEPKYVKVLLERGADVHAVDRILHTPLHWAAWYGNSENVELLIAAGANLDAQDQFGSTPLNSAYGFGDNTLDCQEALLAADADPNIPDDLGFTPLLSAVMYGSSAELELLIMYGADLEYVMDDGNNALSYALSEGKADISALLRKYGAKEPSIEMLWDIEHMEMPGG